MQPYNHFQPPLGGQCLHLPSLLTTSTITINPQGAPRLLLWPVMWATPVLVAPPTNQTHHLHYLISQIHLYSGFGQSQSHTNHTHFTWHCCCSNITMPYCRGGLCATWHPSSPPTSVWFTSTTSFQWPATQATPSVQVHPPSHRITSSIHATFCMRTMYYKFVVWGSMATSLTIIFKMDQLTLP